MSEAPHCRVCWDKVYGLWVDPTPHGGVCPFGATAAHECQQAMMRARQSADAIKMLGLNASPPPAEATARPLSAPDAGAGDETDT